MLASYSNNSLEAFRSCPRKFKFRYIEKVEVPERVSADTYLGNAVHRTLATAYKLAGDGVLWPKDVMIKAYLGEWDKPARSSLTVLNEYLTVDDYIKSGRDMLEKYYDRYQPFRDGTLLGVEISLSYRVPNTPFKLNGRIDRLWKRPDGVIDVIDYKTGKSLPRPTDPGFRHQMGIYQLMVQSTYPQFQHIELAQYCLKLDEVVRSRMSPEEIDELAEQIRQEIVATLHAEKIDDFPTQESAFCNYCEFFALCPAKRHLLILESEEGRGDNDERTSMQSASELAQKYIALDDQFKSLKAEHDALKEDLVRTARELGIDKLTSPAGDVNVKLGREEKFVGKSKDPEAFAELSHLARQLNLDDCFSLDTSTLKDVYDKERLPSDQLAELAKFLSVQDTSRVTVRKKKKVDSEDD